MQKMELGAQSKTEGAIVLLKRNTMIIQNHEKK